MVVVVWHLLAHDCTHDELGADLITRRIDTEARQRHWYASSKLSVAKSLSSPPH
jgi:hypothetical protein